MEDDERQKIYEAIVEPLDGILEKFVELKNLGATFKRADGRFTHTEAHTVVGYNEYNIPIALEGFSPIPGNTSKTTPHHCTKIDN